MIRVVVAEDQKMLLGALTALLELENDIEVVGKATGGEEAVRLALELKPDICVMDIEMPGLSGLDAAERLKGTGIKVIILTTFARPGYFERAVKAGVHGYLLKDSPSEELAEAIRSVAAGKKTVRRRTDGFRLSKRQSVDRAGTRSSAADGRRKNDAGHRRPVVPYPRNGAQLHFRHLRQTECQKPL